MPDVDGDCFSELKKDLTADSKLADTLADLKIWLAKVKPVALVGGSGPLGDAMQTSLEVFIELLKKAQADTTISKGAKALAGKERARLESLLRLRKATIGMKANGELPSLAEHKFLQSRFSNSKVNFVFGKDYPFDAKQAYATYLKAEEDLPGLLEKEAIEFDSGPDPNFEYDHIAADLADEALMKAEGTLLDPTLTTAKLQEAEKKAVFYKKGLLTYEEVTAYKAANPEVSDYVDTILKSLGIDPDSKPINLPPFNPTQIGTPYGPTGADVIKYIHSQGGKYPVAMDSAMKKDWVQAHIGTMPQTDIDAWKASGAGSPAEIKQSIESAAKAKIQAGIAKKKAAAAGYLEEHKVGIWKTAWAEANKEKLAGIDTASWPPDVLKGYVVETSDPSSSLIAKLDKVDHAWLAAMVDSSLKLNPIATPKMFHPLYKALVETPFTSPTAWTAEMKKAYASHFGIPVSADADWDGYGVYYLLHNHYSQITSNGVDADALKNALLEPSAPTLPIGISVGQSSYYSASGKVYALDELKAAHAALAKAKGSSVKPHLQKIGSPLANVDAKSWAKSTNYYGIAGGKEKIVYDLEQKIKLLETKLVEGPYKLPPDALVPAPKTVVIPIEKKFPKPDMYDYYVNGEYWTNSPSQWPLHVLQHWMVENGQDPTGKIKSELEQFVVGNQAKLAAEKVKAEADALKLRFTKANVQPNLGGMHSKVLFTDQHGNQWMGKSNSGEDFRVDTEDAALKIQRLFGFTAPDSMTERIGGKYYHLQKMHTTVDGNVRGIEPEELTDQQLQDALDEHLIDWVEANHDTHVENLLRLENGRIVGIDKGQAYKFFGKDRLEIGYLPPGNGAPVYYDKIYRAMQSGKISKERADVLVTTALKRARRMQRTSDAAYRQHLERAFANRPASTMPGGREAFIDAILARKNNLEADFTTFYKKVYADAGLEFDINLTVTSQLDTGEFIGLSQDILEHVAKVKGHGTSTFYASTDIEGGHEFLWEELTASPNGIPSRTLAGEMKLRKEADAKMMDFIAKQPGVKVTYHSTTPSVSPADTLPNSDHWWQTIESAVKHTSKHAVDGSYNESYYTNLAVTKAAIQKAKDEAAKNTWPALVKSGGKHKQDAYEAMLDHYLAAIKATEEAKSLAQKVPKGTYAKVTYKAPAKAGAPPAPEPAIDYKITKKNADYAKGTYDVNSGLVTVTPGSTGTLSGPTYEIKLSETLTVEYRPWQGNPISQQGQLRFRQTEYDGSLTELDLFHSFMDTVGISLNPASDQDLELLYWRQLAGAIQAHSDNSTYIDAAAAKAIADAVGDVTAEIEAIKAALSKRIPRSRLDAADWHPKFQRLNPLEPGLDTGRPYWERPDVLPSELPSLLNQHFPVSSLTGAGSHDRQRIVTSGGMMSTEERLRLLHQQLSGMSSTSDMGTGGANYIFTRLGRTNGDVFYNPRAMLRVTTYGFSSDNFGRVENRSSSAKWHQSAWNTRSSGPSNETMFKNSMSVLDDIEVFVFHDASELKETLSWFRDHGITEIRGLKVEERFVMASGRASAISKAWAKWKELNQ